MVVGMLVLAPKPQVSLGSQTRWQLRTFVTILRLKMLSFHCHHTTTIVLTPPPPLGERGGQYSILPSKHGNTVWTYESLSLSLSAPPPFSFHCAYRSISSTRYWVFFARRMNWCFNRSLAVGLWKLQHCQHTHTCMQSSIFFRNALSTKSENDSIMQNQLLSLILSDILAESWLHKKENQWWHICLVWEKVHTGCQVTKSQCTEMLMYVQHNSNRTNIPIGERSANIWLAGTLGSVQLFLLL